MSVELKQILSRAGARSSEFWALVIAMWATLGGSAIGVESSVLIAMWGGVSAYAAGRTWHKNTRAKVLAEIDAHGNEAQDVA